MRSRDNQIFAIATHDSNIIQKSLNLFYLYRCKKEHLQFQFLKGIREKLKINLLSKGFSVHEYYHMVKIGFLIPLEDYGNEKVI